MSLIIGREVVDWVAKQTNEYGHFGTDVGIGWERDGKIVAGVAYADWNGVNFQCHIASDRSRKWLTRTYLRTIFDYPFNQANAKRITVCVGQGNADSVNFVEHLSFKLETTLSRAHPTGDLLVYRMFREECKWISPGFALQ